MTKTIKLILTQIFIGIMIFSLLVTMMPISSSINSEDFKLDSQSRAHVARPVGTRADDLEKAGDWIVTGPELVENKTVLAKGNITIQAGGELIFKNVDLKMDTTAKPLLINVTEGGTFQSYDSSISISTSRPEEHFSYTFRIYGNTVIDNCYIAYVGHISDNYTNEPDSPSCGTDLPTYELPWDGFGIEIYSDNVTISNSNISYSNSGLTCFEASPNIYNNTISFNLYGIVGIGATLNLFNNEISNNSIAVFCNDSELNLQTNRIFDNQYGISVSYSELVVNTTEIYRNYEGIFGWMSNIVCENTLIYQNEVYGIYFQEANLSVYNCSFFHNYYGIYGSYSGLGVDNSELYNNWVGIKADDCSGELNNNIFTSNYFQGVDTFKSVFTVYNCTILGNPLENQDYTADNTGIAGAQSNFVIYDCTIRNNRVGIDDGYSSTYKIYNNHISNNYNGIFNFLADEFEVYNNTIVDNYAGIYSWDSNFNVHSNLITRNTWGVVYKQFSRDSSEWEINIADNIIANNTDWGIYTFNYEPDITKNTFVDDDGTPNGQGILLEEFPFIVYVYDSYNDPIALAKVEIQDQFGNTVVSGMTNTDGELEVYNLTYYKLFNDNSETYYTPHEITVKWGADEFGYITDQASIEISETPNVTFKFNLPDLYINDDDVTFSNSRPESGDEVVIEATVHYTGDMPASNVTIVFTASGVVIDEVNIDKISDGESQKVAVTWKVYSVSDATVNIRVRIDPPTGFEYHSTVNRDYRKNNNVSQEVNVKGEDEPTQGFALTGEECIAVAPVITIVFIVILIIIIIVIRKRIKSKKKQVEEEDKNEEVKPGGPKRPRPPEFRRPPQSGRLPARQPPGRPAKPEADSKGIQRVQNPWK